MYRKNKFEDMSKTGLNAAIESEVSLTEFRFFWMKMFCIVVTLESDILKQRITVIQGEPIKTLVHFSYSFEQIFESISAMELKLSDKYLNKISFI